MDDEQVQRRSAGTEDPDVGPYRKSCTLIFYQGELSRVNGSRLVEALLKGAKALLKEAKALVEQLGDRKRRLASKQLSRHLSGVA